jgi:hypothetical protein
MKDCHTRAAGWAGRGHGRLDFGCAFCNDCQLLTDVTDGVSFWLTITVALLAPLLSVHLPLRVYIYGGGEAASCYNTYEHSQTCCTQPFPSHLMRAQRVWESRPLKSPSAELHLHGCASDQVFGSILATAHSIRSTNADQVLHRRHRLWDCTAYICLHRLCTTTSNLHTRYLV